MATTLDLTRGAAGPPVASKPSGLHGHSLDTHALIVAGAEALGTCVLTLTIIVAAIAATLAKPIAGAPYDSLTVAVAGGVALTILVAALGTVSGAHFNPAVTLGLAATRRFPWSRVPIYVVAQLAGAIVAALVAWAMYGSSARSVANLGATAPAAGVTAGRAFAAEAVVTFVLVFVIVIVATGARPASHAPFAIGGALLAAILVSGPISGAGVNPARALGPMLVAGQLADWWVYVAAPIVGALVATVIGGQVARVSAP
jgi:aquaporin Z/aquaporin NIP